MRRIVHTFVLDYPDEATDSQIDMAHGQMLVLHPKVPVGGLQNLVDPSWIDNGWYQEQLGGDVTQREFDQAIEGLRKEQR